MLHVVVMAGGGGTRLWPLSTKQSPKQFLRIDGTSSMIRQTLERLEGLVPGERIWIVTITEQLQALRNEDLGLPESNLIAEPAARNTAPAIGLAAVRVRAADPDATMLVLPADHLIRDRAAFQQAVRSGLELIEQQGGIVTLGVEPTRPETGFGYIETGQEIRNGVHRVKQFREKPDAPTAKEFLQAGSFLWNSGIFLWRVPELMELFASHMPTLAEQLEGLAELKAEQHEALAQVYGEIEPISVDYGILEHAETIHVVRAPFDWSDVGGYAELHRLGEADEQDNVLSGEVFAQNTQASYLRNETEMPLAVVGLEGIVVVATENGILVCPQEQTGAIRDVRAWVDKREEEKGQ